MLKTLNIKTILFIFLLLASSFYILDTSASAQSLSQTVDCNPALPPNYSNLPQADKDRIRQSYTDRNEKFNDKPCDIPAFIRFLKNLINFAITVSVPLATGSEAMIGGSSIAAWGAGIPGVPGA